MRCLVTCVSRWQWIDLVCGDVGLVKQVAMRAAFMAVDNHKQVAVLVPTLLAQQHYDNFRDRFANWPYVSK